MKKQKKHKNRILKRALCFTLALTLLFNRMPFEMVSDNLSENSGTAMNVKAAEDIDAAELAALTARYTANAYSFTSGGIELSEYSKCFQDATWAAGHVNDVLTLNPVNNKFVFDNNYRPIGNESAPFNGTIIYNTSADDFAVEANDSIFNYVSDSAKLQRIDGENISININRVSDVGSTISPLLAVHVVGSNSADPHDWKVTLNSASAKSYSGVIYEMTGGAKTNLTFEDNSSHTPVTDANGNITSGSIIDNKEDSKNYGIICGSVRDGSVLKTTYTKTNDDNVTFIGTETAWAGGLIGEIDGSEFELLSGSGNLKVDFQTAQNHVGFICGHAENSTITLPADYAFSGTVEGKLYAGGIAGYCKDTTVNYSTSTGTITLTGCNIKNGSDASATGGVFGYYECNTAANDILLNRTYNLTNCTVESGKGYSGGIAGDYKPTYTDASTIDLDRYTLDSTITLSGTTAGGLFGRYTASGSVIVTDTDPTNSSYTPPASSASYGGVIGEYVNAAYANTLTLSDFTVNNLSSTSTGSVGGVVGVLNGSTYVSVSGVSVTNATADSAAYFGGIVSTLDNNNAGSFIDVTGNFTLSMASGKKYKGGAIAGSFKKGVIRLAGITDISGAQAENGYAQLVFENDETLVYAKGSGSDANWTLIRNADTTASDLGQWGEVVRLFNGQNAENAGVVTADDTAHTVTVAAASSSPSIADTAAFAKVALNMQLNDGSDHGALCFASGSANKTDLLSSTITISGTIDLSGTGLLGLMRDGGNGCYYNVNNKQDDSRMIGSPDYFTGTITGSNAEIKLAVGESYGSGNAKGGKIYLSHNNGHSAQGLVSFANGAAVSGITVSGSMNVERVDNAGDALHMGAVMGFMTNGAQLTNISVVTQMDFTRSHQNGKIYIGGVAGLFDGDGTGKLIIDGASSSVSPTITLHGSQAAYSEDSYDSRNSYTGGVLGLLGGKTTSKYDVEISNADVSPTITLDTDVANTDYSYLGGMIGRVRSNTTNERSIKLDTVTMTGASVDTKSKFAGGLLGSHWERTNLTVDGLTITGSTVAHKYSGTGSKQSGLAFKATGKWDINSLSISSSNFTSVDAKSASFGLIVNEAYSNDDGLYINLKNSGYSLTGVTVPTSSTDVNYYVDEIAADTKNNDKDGGDITAGGNGTGVININMNIANGTKTKIVDGSNGTGTYQNQLALGNLIANRNSRYYYNLDVMLAKGNNGSGASGGEQFLLWSVRKYAAGNIKNYFKSNDNMISSTDIDLSGLSYYPIAGGEVKMPASATVTFGFDAIRDYEDTSSTADSWKRFPDDVGAPKSPNAQNQHYLMQTGLFTTVTKFETQTSLTLAGDFGYVEGHASGALINKSTSGTVTLTGLMLNGLKPSSADSYMLINSIDGTGTATPTLTVSNLRAENYASETTQPVAKSLFGTATGQNMTMTFSDIKLDARDGEEIKDSKWTTGQNSAASAMDTAYGTSRSIFSTATIFTELWAAKTCNMEYNYAVEKDWNTPTGPREVTYGKEVTASIEYPNGEKRYFLAGDAYGNWTNPVSNSGIEFDFSSGFLPYVGNYTDKGKNTTYPVTEIKVNYKVPGITIGCGTYNDPYIISGASQLETIAKAINGTDYPSTIRLPNYSYDNHVSISWHDGTVNPKGCGIYNLSGTNYNKASDNTNGVSDGTWTQTKVRYYLASAYYKIEGNLELSEDFPGIGVPNDSKDANNKDIKGNGVFHGVIVGDSTSKPTITNPTNNPFIVVANGAVVKNINITNTGTITREQSETGNNALYGYNGSTTDAKYYGGVIGEIMGGDNIIDDVTVTYTSTTTLSGSYAHIIAEGGMVGCVVNGALIFRGSNTVTGRSASGGGIYSNPYVGRVINGYAIYEKIEDRTGTAPANGSYYPIDTIDRSNENLLDVNYAASTITVPDAQSLYIMSLITQSIASTADTSKSNEDYNVYSPSYGYNSYLYGVARLGDYTDVGCGTTAAQPDDYSQYAYRDSVNNYYSSKQDLVNAPTPYIIYRYTKAYGTDNVTSKNYPARKMTSDNSKFWDITLSSSSTFASMDSFQAFRGIGSVGINAKTATDTTAKTALKVWTFDGGGNTINLHISLMRYGRDQENYFHYQNKSLTQGYSGEELSVPYGHDQNLTKLMGVGLFDCVMVKNDSNHEYQFKNFKLQGTVEDIVYNSKGVCITGTTNQTQLFCVGGVYGKRVNGNASDVNFQDITFNGLTISSAYSCGGLVGIDAVKTYQQMKIDGCNSTSNGISVTGGCFANGDLRHGIGCFVGMTFWTRPYIDGDDNTTEQVETANISVSNVTTFYDGDSYASVAGGLIGYTGSGAEIRNVNLSGLGSNPVIGSNKVLNAGGFIGFSQADSSNKTIGYVVFDNCTLNGISVQAKNSAAGFLARCGNTNATFYPRAVSITNCAVIGNAQSKPEIRAFGTNTTDSNRLRFGAGGFVADLSMNSGEATVTSTIDNCYIKDYIIEGSNVGGIIGTETTKPAYLKNLFVKDCDIITTLATDENVGNIGGMVGRSEQNLSGYNLKIDGVNFYRRSGETLTDVTNSDAGIIVGRNKNSSVNKFIAIGAYHSDLSKVPTVVVKINGTNTGSFFVFADYNNTSASDITAGAGYESSFNANSNSDMPLAPFVNVDPHMGMGTDEYLTGDGAGVRVESDGEENAGSESIGIAGEIYKDAKAGSSNRRYTIGATLDPSFTSTEKRDSAVLAKYIDTDGKYTNGVFKISTASAEFGDVFPTGVDDFAMLVINDDSALASDITPFIKSYIRLVTNAAVNPAASLSNDNTPIYSQYAYGISDNTEINKLYTVVIRPCYYSEKDGRFVLGTAGSQGLSSTNGSYTFDSSKADSESDKLCQFSLIDVQYKDPTDAAKIAYHLYVPVYTKKMMSAKFSAVTMSETKYYRSPYADRIASELEAGRTTINPSQLVESTNEWTTTFIRYTYPKNQVPNEDWNYNKSINIMLDSNFNKLPANTRLVLVDPNAGADKFYTMTLDGSWPTGSTIQLDLSQFVAEDGVTHFTPQHLSAIRTDTGATGIEDGKEVLYEDYYISMYVPKVEGQTHSVLFSSGTEMSCTDGTITYKANIEPKLNSLVVLGDLFDHHVDTFKVESGDGNSYGDAREMSNRNNVLKTNVKATVKIKDQSAGAFLANSQVYHSFFITLTSHYEDRNVSDAIYGITPGDISNTTTYSYEKGGNTYSQTITKNYSLETNYIELDTGSIIRALYDPTSTPTLTIEAETIMKFYDTTAFPYNVSGAMDNEIGTQVSVKSSLAYRTEDLRFSALNKVVEDPDVAFYFSTSKNNAELSFNAVPTEDETDEIGYKTNNRSLLGVNGKYGDSHPVIGRSMYNVDDVVDYDSATQLQYTIELYKKVSDGQGTRYVKVSKISDYMTDVNMVDTKVDLRADKTTDPSKYVFTGDIVGENSEKMFEAVFSCNVLTGDTGPLQYANYKIQLTAQLIGPSNSLKDAYLIYTNAKFDPSVIQNLEEP